MKAFLNWSGGKDSALCLQAARQEGIAIGRLVTVLHKGRVSLHGVPKELIERQAQALGLPVSFIELSDQPTMSAYEERMRATHKALATEGFTHALYGDIFLEDLRQYRNGLLAKDGISGIYPLWGSNTGELAERFIRDGFKAVIVSVNETALPRSCCGCLLNADFLRRLPGSTDPCGENGEYHSFVFDGPVFLQPVSFERGAILQRSYPAPRDPNDDCFTEARPETIYSFCELKA